MGTGTIDVFVAELGGFFEAFVLEGNRTDLAQKAKFAETNRVIRQGLVFHGTDDGEGDGQIHTGFVDG